MKKVLIYSMLFAGISGVNAQIDIMTINATMDTIPYMFEGRVEKVDIFAGDNDGRKKPNSSATWSGKYGTFGDDVYGYSDASIRVCKIYKDVNGVLSGGDILQVLTRSFQIGGLYLEKVGSDTLTRYVFTPSQYDHPDEFRMFLPASDGLIHSKIFIATRISTIDLADYIGQNHYSNFKSYVEVPLMVPVDIEQPDGSSIRDVAYANIVPYVFKTSEDFNFFLGLITSINPSPASYCDAAMTINGITEHSNNSFVKVFPNPTSGSVKVVVNSPSTLSVYDATGRLILKKDVQSETNIDVASGLYILQIKSGDSSFVTKLICE